MWDDKQAGRDNEGGMGLAGLGSVATCAQAFAVTKHASGFAHLPDCSPAP